MRGCTRLLLLDSGERITKIFGVVSGVMIACNVGKASLQEECHTAADGKKFPEAASWRLPSSIRYHRH